MLLQGDKTMPLQRDSPMNLGFETSIKSPRNSAGGYHGKSPNPIPNHDKSARKSESRKAESRKTETRKGESRKVGTDKHEKYKSEQRKMISVSYPGSEHHPISQRANTANVQTGTMPETGKMLVPPSPNAVEQTSKRSGTLVAVDKGTEELHGSTDNMENSSKSLRVSPSDDGDVDESKNVDESKSVDEPKKKDADESDTEKVDDMGKVDTDNSIDQSGQLQKRADGNKEEGQLADELDPPNAPTELSELGLSHAPTMSKPEEQSLPSELLGLASEPDTNRSDTGVSETPSSGDEISILNSAQVTHLEAETWRKEREILKIKRVLYERETARARHAAALLNEIHLDAARSAEDFIGGYSVNPLKDIEKDLENDPNQSGQDFNHYIAELKKKPAPEMHKHPYGMKPPAKKDDVWDTFDVRPTETVDSDNTTEEPSQNDMNSITAGLELEDFLKSYDDPESYEQVINPDSVQHNMNSAELTAHCSLTQDLDGILNMADDGYGTGPGQNVSGFMSGVSGVIEIDDTEEAGALLGLDNADKESKKKSRKSSKKSKAKAPREIEDDSDSEEKKKRKSLRSLSPDFESTSRMSGGDDNAAERLSKPKKARKSNLDTPSDRNRLSDRSQRSKKSSRKSEKISQSRESKSESEKPRKSEKGRKSESMSEIGASKRSRRSESEKPDRKSEFVKPRKSEKSRRSEDTRTKSERASKSSKSDRSPKRGMTSKSERPKSSRIPKRSGTSSRAAEFSSLSRNFAKHVESRHEEARSSIAEASNTLESPRNHGISVESHVPGFHPSTSTLPVMPEKRVNADTLFYNDNIAKKNDSVTKKNDSVAKKNEGRGKSRETSAEQRHVFFNETLSPPEVMRHDKKKVSTANEDNLSRDNVSGDNLSRQMSVASKDSRLKSGSSGKDSKASGSTHDTIAYSSSEDPHNEEKTHPDHDGHRHSTHADHPQNYSDYSEIMYPTHGRSIGGYGLDGANLDSEELKLLQKHQNEKDWKIIQEREQKASAMNARDSMRLRDLAFFGEEMKFNVEAYLMLQEDWSKTITKMEAKFSANNTKLKEKLGFDPRFQKISFQSGSQNATQNRNMAQSLANQNQNPLSAVLGGEKDTKNQVVNKVSPGSAASSSRYHVNSHGHGANSIGTPSNSANDDIRTKYESDIINRNIGDAYPISPTAVEWLKQWSDAIQEDRRAREHRISQYPDHLPGEKLSKQSSEKASSSSLIKKEKDSGGKSGKEEKSWDKKTDSDKKEGGGEPSNLGQAGEYDHANGILHLDPERKYITVLDTPRDQNPWVPLFGKEFTIGQKLGKHPPEVYRSKLVSPETRIVSNLLENIGLASVIDSTGRNTSENLSSYLSDKNRDTAPQSIGLVERAARNRLVEDGSDLRSRENERQRILCRAQIRMGSEGKGRLRRQNCEGRRRGTEEGKDRRGKGPRGKERLEKEDRRTRKEEDDIKVEDQCRKEAWPRHEQLRIERKTLRSTVEISSPSISSINKTLSSSRTPSWSSDSAY